MADAAQRRRAPRWRRLDASIGPAYCPRYTRTEMSDLTVYILRCGHSGHLRPARGDLRDYCFRCGCIGNWEWYGSDAASMSTPGRSRTDTGDPFRGPASSLGLRGRIHNTARAIAEPVSSEDLFNYFLRPRLLHTNCRA